MKQKNGIDSHLEDFLQFLKGTQENYNCWDSIVLFFDKIFGIELKGKKAKSLEKILRINKDTFLQIHRDDILPGDILVFYANYDAPAHFGIYLGDNKFFHHYPDKGPCISKLTDPMWELYYYGAYRYRDWYC